MKDDGRVWAYCPTCCHRQRFIHVEVNHAFHAVMTVLTCGLWLISWAAVWIGYRFVPWRCKHCGCSAPDFHRKVAPPDERTEEEQKSG